MAVAFAGNSTAIQEMFKRVAEYFTESRTRIMITIIITTLTTAVIVVIALIIVIIVMRIRALGFRDATGFAVASLGPWRLGLRDSGFMAQGPNLGVSEN